MSLVSGMLFSRRAGFPAVHDRHLQVHQDDVRPLADRLLTTLLSIFRGYGLEIARAYGSRDIGARF